MIRSNPHNLAIIYNKGRTDALKGRAKEERRWTVRQHQEYWAGWYSVKAPNGVLPSSGRPSQEEF